MLPGWFWALWLVRSFLGVENSLEKFFKIQISTSIPVFQYQRDKWDTFCVGAATCQRKVDGTGGDKLIDASFHLFHSRTDKLYTSPPPPNFHAAGETFEIYFSKLLLTLYSKVSEFFSIVSVLAPFEAWLDSWVVKARKVSSSFGIKFGIPEYSLASKIKGWPYLVRWRRQRRALLLLEWVRFEGWYRWTILASRAQRTVRPVGLKRSI